ncbi:hypothetical protein RV02_GL000039 [Enterococcus gilvus]|nr:hypothetical protein RV02_GL000039 [Enterococcus gilvus]
MIVTEGSRKYNKVTPKFFNEETHFSLKKQKCLQMYNDTFVF